MCIAIIILSLTVVLPSITLLYVRKKGYFGSTACVRMPTGIWVASILSGVASSVLSIKFLYTQDALFPTLIVLFALVSLICLVIALNIFIFYDKDGFTLVRLFQRPRRFDYGEICEIAMGGNMQFTLYTKHNRIHVDQLAVGRIEFYGFCQQQYIMTTAKRIPERRHRLFHGYIHNPWEFVLIPLVLGIVYLFFAICVTINLRAVLPTELLCINTNFQYITEDGGDVVFYTQYGHMRVDKRSIESVEHLYREAKTGAVFSALVEPWRENGNQKHTIIWELECLDGHLLIQKETVLENRKVNYLQVKMILWFATAVHWLGFLAAFYVLNHAPQYPRLAALLVKKNYRNF